MFWCQNFWKLFQNVFWGFFEQYFKIVLKLFCFFSKIVWNCSTIVWKILKARFLDLRHGFGDLRHGFGDLRHGFEKQFSECFYLFSNCWEHMFFEETSNLGESLKLCPNELNFGAIGTEFYREATFWLRLLRGLWNTQFCSIRLIDIAHHAAGYVAKLAPDDLILIALCRERPGEAESELRLLRCPWNNPYFPVCFRFVLLTMRLAR